MTKEPNCITNVWNNLAQGSEGSCHLSNFGNEWNKTKSKNKQTKNSVPKHYTQTHKVIAHGITC